MYFPGEANMLKIQKIYIFLETMHIFCIFFWSTNAYICKNKCQGNMHLPREANMQKIRIFDMHLQHVDMHCAVRLEAERKVIMISLLRVLC